MTGLEVMILAPIPIQAYHLLQWEGAVLPFLHKCYSNTLQKAPTVATTAFYKNPPIVTYYFVIATHYHGLLRYQKIACTSMISGNSKPCGNSVGTFLISHPSSVSNQSLLLSSQLSKIVGRQLVISIFTRVLRITLQFFFFFSISSLSSLPSSVTGFIRGYSQGS